jgi:streptogramin lyase
MDTRARVGLALALGLGVLWPVEGALAAPTITEFPVTTKDRAPLGIAAGPDGNVWFAENSGSGGVGRIAPNGTVTEFTTGITGPAQGIALGPDGNLWFAETNPEKIGRITPTGTVTEFALPKGSKPNEITAGPDGNLWFTESANPGRIGRITTEGTITEFTSGLTTNSEPRGITAGPDGNLWFTEAANPGRIGRITAEGTITEFSSGLTTNSQPQGITAGPDGNLWFTEAANPGRIGRITITGAITEFSTGLSANGEPAAITAGSDGNVYFTEKGASRIGEITPAGAISEIATPTAKMSPQGITTGPNGNIWFTEAANPGQLGTMTVAPSVGTTSTSSVAEQSAILRAVVGPNSQATTYHFEYGPTTAYGIQTSPSSAGSGSTPSTVSSAVSGLSASTSYHFRVVASNGSGTTYGADQTFTTITPPRALSQPATAVTLTGATLNGLVDPEGQTTTYRFEWGPSTSYGNQTPALEGNVGSDTSEHALAQAITGLTPHTSYHFRVVASNCGGCAEGTTFGTDQAFTTAAPPTATSGAAQMIGTTSATVTGTVNPNGVPTSYQFEWGETTAYGSRTPTVAASVGSDTTEHALSQSLTGLSPGTVYHYRIVATNCEGCLAGTTRGADMTLRTEGLALTPPLAPTPTASSSTPAVPPRLGSTAVVRAVSGTVLVRVSGSLVARPLSGEGNVPIGSLIIADHGTVLLITGVDRRGHIQSATIWGGSFIVNQTVSRGGLTTLTLAGGSAAACRRGHAPSGRTAAIAASNRSRVIRSLWAKDSHGHFSTRGQNSVATVRGTYWGTVDRCDGTLTIVKQGVVSVRASRGRRVIVVHAGQRYLAGH